MKSIIVNLSDDLHMAFKLACVQENKSMSEVILAWINDKIEKEKRLKGRLENT